MGHACMKACVQIRGAFTSLLAASVLDSNAAARLGAQVSFVSRVGTLAHGEVLPSGPRAKVLEAVSWWTDKTDAKTWQRNRVATAAYLVFAAPQFQIVR